MFGDQRLHLCLESARMRSLMEPEQSTATTSSPTPSFCTFGKNSPA
jgi:hypothetical protein